MADASALITDRVRLWARTMCEADGVNPDRSVNEGQHQGFYVGDLVEWQLRTRAATAVVALADAEAAERVAKGAPAASNGEDEMTEEVDRG